MAKLTKNRKSSLEKYDKDKLYSLKEASDFVDDALLLDLEFEFGFGEGEKKSSVFNCSFDANASNMGCTSGT